MISSLAPNIIDAILREAKKYNVEPKVEVSDKIKLTLSPEDVEKLLLSGVPEQYRNLVKVKAEGGVVIELRLM
jgi:hypothetical protein